MGDFWEVAEVREVRRRLKAAGADPRTCRELLVMWCRSYMDQSQSLDCISGFTAS